MQSRSRSYQSELSARGVFLRFQVLHSLACPSRLMEFFRGDQSPRKTRRNNVLRVGCAQMETVQRTFRDGLEIYIASYQMTYP